MSTEQLVRPSLSRQEQERKKAELVLERREQQLADAQQIAQLGSWEWDISSGEMSWSDELFRILGCEPTAFPPSFGAFLGTIHPEDREYVERRIQETLLNPACLEFEYRIVRPNGDLRSVNCRAEVISGEGGAPARMIGTAHDVTELRRFASALTSQVEQLQQLSQASVSIYAAEGIEEILEVATGYAMRILGARVARGTLSDGKATGEAAVYLCRDGTVDPAPPAAPLGSDPLEHPIRIGTGEVDHHPMLQNLGEEERAVLRRGWMAVPLVDLLGGAGGAIHLFEKNRGDFTDGDEAILVQVAQITSLALQKARLFDALQASQARYRRLFEAHLSGDFVTASDGTFVEVNPALARMLGYSSPEALKKVNLTQLYAEPDEWERLSVRVRHEGGALQQETQFIRADGSPITAILHIVGVQGRAGEISAFQGCVFDVTEWKSAEAALRESQQQLLQAQKMEAVGQLAGGIAHDFNNMLMAIQGFADLLEEEIAPTASARSHLSEIRKAADRSTRLTRQLLAYSRKQVLQPETLDLNSVVSGIEDMLRRLIGEHIDFNSVLDPETGRLHADPSQLQQVLMNLVLNARDAMADGGRLTVRTGKHTIRKAHNYGDFKLPAGEYTMLTVEDTGCGIPPELLPRIYEPFFTTKAIGNGSGLGLSTVYGIVKQSGGYIRANSRPGEGTTFTLYFPRLAAAGPVVPGDRQARARTEQAGSSATILIAEDESVLRSLAALVLRRSGYTVLEAEDGMEALEIAQKQGYQIDMLVTDLVMPRMGGQPLASRLLEHRPDLKIVFMSGYAEEAVARHGHLVAGTTFLEKPFSPNVLARTVRDIFSDRPAASAM